MMDNHDALPESDDDRTLHEALSRLRQLEPPPETRIANRAAVAAALDAWHAARRQHQLPWWRRSIAVPVPVAASVAVVAALALASSFRGGAEQLPPQVGEPDKQSSIVERAPRSRAELKYYETETYLCGIGRVSSESHYSLEE